jgi:hypothetical protein
MAGRVTKVEGLRFANHWLNTSSLSKLSTVKVPRFWFKNSSEWDVLEVCQLSWNSVIVRAILHKTHNRALLMVLNVWLGDYVRSKLCLAEAEQLYQYEWILSTSYITVYLLLWRHEIMLIGSNKFPSDLRMLIFLEVILCLYRCWHQRCFDNLVVISLVHIFTMV